MGWKLGVSASAAILLLAVAMSVARVEWRESREVRAAETMTLGQRIGSAGSTRESVRLTQVRLHAEQDAVFELCADDRMLSERWVGALAVAVWRPAAQELMTRSELTESVLGRVRRNETRGCLVVGRGRVEHEDDYAVEVLFDALPRHLVDVPLTVRVLGRHPMNELDRILVLLAGLGSLGFVLSLALRTPAKRSDWPAVEPSMRDAPDPAPSEEDLDASLWEAVRAEVAPRRRFPGEVRVGAGLLLVAGSFFASRFLPAGAALGLAAGAALVLFEAMVGLALSPSGGALSRLRSLALVRPGRWWLHFPVALLTGVMLVVVARRATELVPSTGESPVQTFVSFPSGMLSFAALAAIAPLGEETFFRGFVYGGLEKRHTALAFAGGWLLFVAAHAPQTWGQWGALVAIAVTGLGLTTLRAVSGSTLVAALAHLVYNGLLALSAL